MKHKAKTKAQTITLGFNAILSRLYQISKQIPAFEITYQDWEELWNYGQFSDEDKTESDEYVEQIATDIENRLQDWINHTPDMEIVRTLKKFKIEKDLEGAFILLKALVENQHKWFFESNKKLIPADACRYLFVFAPIRRKSIDRTINGREVKIPLLNNLTEPLVKTFEHGSLTIEYVRPTTSALKTFTVLVYLMKQRKVNVSEKNYGFNTSYYEILKLKGVKNPWCPYSRESVVSDLKELMGTLLTMDYDKFRFCGSILDGTKEKMQEDNNGKLRIWINRHFLRLYERGYIDLDIQTIHSLSDKELNLYCWLEAQPAFNTGKTFRRKMIQIYEMANLGDLKYKSQIKKEIHKLLKKLQKKELIADLFFDKYDMWNIRKTKRFDADYR